MIRDDVETRVLIPVTEEYFYELRDNPIHYGSIKKYLSLVDSCFISICVGVRDVPGRVERRPLRPDLRPGHVGKHVSPTERAHLRGQPFRQEHSRTHVSNRPGPLMVFSTYMNAVPSFIINSYIF